MTGSTGSTSFDPIAVSAESTVVVADRVCMTDRRTTWGSQPRSV
jgi:hypothetical protein